ncbi:hypothetical protein DH2020_004584 [Rehmannia glutinosa]|uniref:C2 domain-containing protein n=1 Tax=Rehmannia glutinosa TaxID=99300 RepID=A0ABR0XQ47_REHGL
MAPLKPFQLLEINIISAQDLEPVSKKMRTYATAWMHPNRKLSSSVDTEGNNNPTWNDKFVFRVDEEFLRQDTSAVMIEIYAVHWFRDVLVGTVRVLVGNLIPPPSRTHHNGQHYTGMRFVALQIGGKESSILSITDSVVPINGMRKIGKASSVISGAELREKPKHNGKKGKGGSVLSDSILSKESSNFRKMETSDLKPKAEEKNGKTGNDEMVDKATNKAVDEKSVTKTKGSPKEKLQVATIGKPVAKYNNYVIGAPIKKGNSIWSDSEVGPSPSEVAAAVMAERKYPLDDNQSSVLDGWSLDESVEGLRSKLERWRMELPPLYDRGFSSSSYKSSGRHARRHTKGSSGLFSCFGNIFGYECQCICGKPPGKRNVSARFHSPSTLTPGRSFL